MYKKSSTLSRRRVTSSKVTSANPRYNSYRTQKPNGAPQNHPRQATLHKVRRNPKTEVRSDHDKWFPDLPPANNRSKSRSLLNVLKSTLKRKRSSVKNNTFGKLLLNSHPQRRSSVVMSEASSMDSALLLAPQPRIDKDTVRLSRGKWTRWFRSKVPVVDKLLFCSRTGHKPCPQCERFWKESTMTALFSGAHHETTRFPCKIKKSTRTGVVNGVFSIGRSKITFSNNNKSTEFLIYNLSNAKLRDDTIFLDLVSTMEDGSTLNQMFLVFDSPDMAKQCMGKIHAWIEILLDVLTASEETIIRETGNAKPVHLECLLRKRVRFTQLIYPEKDYRIIKALKDLTNYLLEVRDDEALGLFMSLVDEAESDIVKELDV